MLAVNLFLANISHGMQPINTFIVKTFCKKANHG